ncbi:CBS domain containing protein 1, CYSTATHIONE [BETA]-SYNTHASE DOMAIN-CONTAINING PROTEIN 2 [Hibiscus trionum]|uniref:CBS domain containing protein 1, CYSTATHIONE [BETA]-SYNTHASE DOMAIN-CONTAINING PROTEIN 2 n=1 Tax=Hibiscus trionum TaxID=183268 RepID=A0A9W7H0D6_HIBTR|nr:CBS domain containing protein 1, CYSTATHIONE [BETA]-SYNTHASE DOMAIN-CONTAINING PROTEIN 2 [Hibiscus trionum]
MDAVLHSESISVMRLRAISTSAASIHHMPCQLSFGPVNRLLFPLSTTVPGGSRSGKPSASVVVATGTLTSNHVSPRGVYIVGDFMTRKEDLQVVKPTTTVDEALQTLVEHRISGFPVVDDDWKLVGLVSDYDLLALDSISGRPTENDLFPEVDSSWKTFNEIQKLLNKTNGQVVGDLMTAAPLVVRETTNLEDAARLLLKTKYRRLPVVDVEGKLNGIITRGDVVRAALEIKRDSQGYSN